MSAVQFPVGTWVFWHVVKHGNQAVRVGEVVQVFGPEKTTIGVGDIENSESYLHDTRGPGQDVLVDGMPRYVVAVPDATGHQRHLAVPDPRRMLVLRRAPKVIEEDVVESEAPVHLRSKGTAASTELVIDGKKIPRVHKLSLSIDSGAVVMDLQTISPHLNLQGRIISIKEYDPAGDSE